MGQGVRGVVAALAVVAIGVVAGLAPGGSAAAGGETPVTVTVGFEGEETIPFHFGFLPKALRPGSPDVRLKFAIETARAPTGVAPGIASATIGLDRAVELNPDAVPECRGPTVQMGDRLGTAGAPCGRSEVIGHAAATIQYAFPEAEPTTTRIRGPIYNGGRRRGATDLLFEMRSETLGSLWLRVPVRPVQEGRIGSEATLDVPTLSEGAGHLIDLEFELSHVSAECRDGKLSASLEETLTDGTEVAEESGRACTKG